MSIDHDRCLSFVCLMVGHGRSFTAVDWCIAIMCHNVKIVWLWTIVAFGPGCFGVDNAASSLVSMMLAHSVGSQLGLSWCGQ